MIYTELVRLRIEPKQALNVPIFHKGLDRIWHNFDKYKNEVVVQYTGTTTNQYHPIHREQIEKEMEYISKFICQDAVKIQKETPRRLNTLDILVDHPAYNNRERHAVRNHFKNVREVRVPMTEIKRLNESYEKDFNKKLTEVKDIKEDPKTGEQSGIIECGVIEDGNDIRSI